MIGDGSAPVFDLLPRPNTTRPITIHLIERRHTTNPAPYTEDLTDPIRRPQGRPKSTKGKIRDMVRIALTETIKRLPEHLWQSLTWDQGKEMAQHVAFTIDAGIQVFFCDPKSPWQRGSNENTNGLLRQYFPKGTDLSQHTQDVLDQAPYSLNTGPRQTLGDMTPSDKLAEAMQ